MHCKYRLQQSALQERLTAIPLKQHTIGSTDSVIIQTTHFGVQCTPHLFDCFLLETMILQTSLIHRELIPWPLIKSLG